MIFELPLLRGALWWRIFLCHVYIIQCSSSLSVFTSQKVIKTSALLLLQSYYTQHILQCTVLTSCSDVCVAFCYFCYLFIFRSGTDLMSLLISFLLLFFFFSSKKPKVPSFQNRPGWNLTGVFFKSSRIDRRSKTFDLTSLFEHGGHNVFFTQQSAATWWLIEHEASVGAYTVASVSSWSVGHSYLVAFYWRKHMKIIIKLLFIVSSV